MSPAPERVQPSPRHRRQTFWQILLPVILAALAAVALVVFAALATLGGSSMPSTWANISTVWLVIPVIVIGAFFGLTIAGLIFLLARLLRSLPAYTRLVQIYLQLFSLRVDSLLNVLVRPQIATFSRWAAWRQFWRSLFRFGRRA